MDLLDIHIGMIMIAHNCEVFFIKLFSYQKYTAQNLEIHRKAAKAV